MNNGTPEQDLPINNIQLKKLAYLVKAVNHPLRQEIISQIHKNVSINVTDLYCKLRLEQCVASQQLAILRRANIVIATRKSKNIFYSVNYDHLMELNSIAGSLKTYND